MPSLLRPLILAWLLTAPAAAGGYAATPSPTASAPYAGRPNHAHAVSQFHWGWFGAERQAPSIHYHRGYYGHRYGWSSHRW